MGLVLTAAPPVEPVTVDEAKAHLRIDHSDEDAYLASLITASRLQIEAALDIVLISQIWSWKLDSWPDGRELHFPIWPLQSVETVRVTGETGTVDELSLDGFTIDGTSKPARLISASGAWPRPGVPALGIEIAFTAGFGDSADDVPSAVRHALLMLVAHWYEHREPVDLGKTPTPVPEPISALLMPYRTVRL